MHIKVGEYVMCTVKCAACYSLISAVQACGMVGGALGGSVLPNGSRQTRFPLSLNTPQQNGLMAKDAPRERPLVGMAGNAHRALQYKDKLLFHFGAKLKCEVL